MRSWLAGVAVLFLCAVVLIVGVNWVHMRADESLVYDFTRSDLSYLVTYLAAQDSHPPLWFSSFWLWRQLVGDSEYAGRLLAAFYSLLALAVMYQIGQRWFGAPRYGLLTMALLGVNTFFFIHALEIRPYGLIMLLVATSMWTFQRWLTRRTGRAAFWYALTLGAMLYIHYFLFVFMLVQVVCFLLARPGWRMFRQAIHVVTMTVLIWLPWLPFAVYQVIHVRQAEMVGGNERGLLGAGSTTEPTSLEAALRLARLATNGQLLLYGLLLIVGLIYWWRKANYRLALAWAFGVPAMSMLVNLAVAVYVPRYVVYMVLGVGLVAGVGLAVLPTRIRWPGALLAVAIGLVTLPDQMPARVPLRDLYREVSAAALPEDVIFFDSGGLGDGFVRGQVRRYLDPDLWARRVTSIEEARQHRRIWYVTDEEWREDYTREHFAQIERDHPLQEIIGQCDQDWCYLLQLLEGPPLPKAVPFGGILNFYGMDKDTHTPGTLAVRLWWGAAETPVLDYSIGLQLLDSAGKLVAQADGPITDWYSQQPLQTSQLMPGKIYIDSRSIVLPTDLAPGDYQLVLVVYQSWDGTRLTLPDDSDHLALQTIQLSNN